MAETMVNRDVIDGALIGLNAAERVYAVFAGEVHCELSLIFSNEYVAVSFENESWLCSLESYQSALDDVLRKVMSSEMDEDVATCYCEIRDMVSMIYTADGCGTYGGRPDDLTDFLLLTLDPNEVQLFLLRLGIDIDSIGK